MELLFWMIGAHYLGDFALQSDWMASMKGKRWYVMLAHCAIWTTVVCIPVRLLGDIAWWMPIFLLLGHWSMDRYKTSLPHNDHWFWIYLDQSVHLLQLVFVWENIH